MAIIDTALGTKLIFLLGITNIIGLLLVLLSCRCVLNYKLEFTKGKFFNSFYKYHCYYWYFFIISVLLHAILAIYLFGNPL